MPFNPFNNNTEETSFEQGNPLTNAAKTAAQTASAQTQKQITDANKAIVDQLYGSSAPTAQEPGTDEANPQAMDHTNAAHAAGAKSGSQKNSNANQTPEEQAKMEKIRRELFANHSSKYQSAPNGPFGITTNIEMEMEKARQERKQQEQQRKQEEEEEERRKKEEEEKQKQEFAMPSGKNAGRNRMGEPIALRKAKTKVEISRGTDG